MKSRLLYLTFSLYPLTNFSLFIKIRLVEVKELQKYVFSKDYLTFSLSFFKFFFIEYVE